MQRREVFVGFWFFCHTFMAKAVILFQVSTMLFVDHYG